MLKSTAAAKTPLRTTLAAALAVFLAACGGEEQATAPAAVATPEPQPEQEVVEVAKIEGEVFYRERIMLPPGTEVEVQLEDISRADAMATVMASVMLKPQGGPPYPFSIEYNPAEIDERMRYALRVRITDPDGRLRFTNTDYIDPFSGNPVSVLVQNVARTEPREEARTEQQQAPSAGGGAAVAAPAEPEEGTIVWILDTLAGETAPAGAGGKAIDLHMNASKSTAAGFSGCNRYSGGFSTDGGSTHGTPIVFGNLAGTMMACADGGELEQRYLKTLGSVDAYRMEGDNLALLSGSEVVATFKPK
ncbi:META domain-containing protein [Halioglobus maricola]|uniref:META domain-containing protein n=1 Tax=Halioglobus maricola TaxID=2601894 RepID=A0A5P9NR70_9GAMM|nr:YbaY family lipoprotein [Halioglobus maricola]QFU77458.1 META domain-containing protein [Halioglobus maricola]